MPSRANLSRGVVATGDAARPARGKGATTLRQAKPPPLVAVAPRTIVLTTGVAIAGFVLVVFAYATRTVLLQLTVAIVLAMAAEPLVRVFERRGLRRGGAVGVSFVLVALALGVFAYLLLTPLVDETRRLVDDGPALVQQLIQKDARLGFLERRFQIVEHARTVLDSNHLAAAAGPAWNVFGMALRTSGALVSVAFLTLFVQLGGRQWFDSMLQLTPEDARVRLRRAGGGFSSAVGGYVTGNLAISVICGAVTTSVLLATSVPYAFALGAFVAVLDLIPLVGATLGTVIALAVALATRGVATAVVVVVAMLIYQQIENNVLQPLVYHRTVKISPLAIAVSVAIGVELAGVTGALLAIPFAGTLKVVGHEVIAWRRGEETST
jgi:predicted PurR-regulated permease PerM